MRVQFKTKTGKIVSFNRKEGKTLKKPKVRFRQRLKKPSRKPRKLKTGVYKMAKRGRKSRGGSSNTNNLMQVLLGGAVAGFVGSMIPYGNYGKLGIAVVAHKQGGIIGNTAKALGTIGVANMVQGAGIGTATATSSNNTAW